MWTWQTHRSNLLVPQQISDMWTSRYALQSNLLPKSQYFCLQLWAVSSPLALQDGLWTWDVVEVSLSLPIFDSHPVYLQRSINRCNRWYVLRMQVPNERNTWVGDAAPRTVSTGLRYSRWFDKRRDDSVWFWTQPKIVPRERWWAMMALSLMAEHNDVRLAEWPAHSLYFMGTKWIDLWVAYMIFAQAWRATDPLSLTRLMHWVELAICQEKQY